MLAEHFFSFRLLEFSCVWHFPFIVASLWRKTHLLRDVVKECAGIQEGRLCRAQSPMGRSGRSSAGAGGGGRQLTPTGVWWSLQKHLAFRNSWLLCGAGELQTHWLGWVDRQPGRQFCCPVAQLCSPGLKLWEHRMWRAEMDIFRQKRVCWTLILWIFNAR